LATLEINLAPAGSVFDTTVTLDDDPLGGSTPGSSFGYTFGFVGDNAEMSGSVTVTYSGIVNLVGRAADGDLFTTLLIDFSGLDGGGVIGDVSWNSDIDSLLYVGDLAPAGTAAALAGNNPLEGTAASEFLNGAAGDDVLIGGAGDDVLNGGAGADVFVFENGSGNDVIVDFNLTDFDSLAIRDFGFEDIASVLLATTEVDGNAVIQLDADDSVTLVDVSVADLMEHNTWFMG
jgi:Ca2+-binding RTX toxin-like protein